MEPSAEHGEEAGKSLDSLMPLVYDHLRRIARRQLSVRAGDGTLNTTGLVHEAYIKLSDQAGASWTDRAHFLALASVGLYRAARMCAGASSE